MSTITGIIDETEGFAISLPGEPIASSDGNIIGSSNNRAMIFMFYYILLPHL
ncbi:MAG: hypothetical protein WCC17_24710 [Candidatus Nitrosopolaris sp.]